MFAVPTCADAVQLERAMTAKLTSLLAVRRHPESTGSKHQRYHIRALLHATRSLRTLIRDPLDRDTYTFAWVNGIVPTRINRDRFAGKPLWIVSKNGVVFSFENTLDRACHAATL